MHGTCWSVIIYKLIVIVLLLVILQINKNERYMSERDNLEINCNCAFVGYFTK